MLTTAAPFIADHLAELLQAEAAKIRQDIRAGHTCPTCAQRYSHTVVGDHTLKRHFGRYRCRNKHTWDARAHFFDLDDAVRVIQEAGRRPIEGDPT